MTQIDNKIARTALRVRIETAHGSKTLDVAAPPGTTVGEITRIISEREALPILDPGGLISYTYSLRRHGAPDVALDPKAKLDELPFRVEPGDTFLLAQSGTPFKISSSRQALAIFVMNDSWSIDGFQGFLAALRDVYTAVFAQDQILQDRNKERMYRHELRHMHGEIVAHMRADEVLLIKSISVNSPGVIELIGTLNPLETIRKFLEDHRKAKAEAEAARNQKAKDDKYRDAVEQAKHVLDIESLKTRVAKERADMLRDAGYSQQEVRPYVEEVLTRPLSQLLVYQDNNQLHCQSVTELESVEIEVVVEDAPAPLMLGPGELP